VDLVLAAKTPDRLNGIVTAISLAVGLAATASAVAAPSLKLIVQNDWRAEEVLATMTAVVAACSGGVELQRGTKKTTLAARQKELEDWRTRLRELEQLLTSTETQIREIVEIDPVYQASFEESLSVEENNSLSDALLAQLEKLQKTGNELGAACGKQKK
jgi:hypothetical protein